MKLELQGEDGVTMTIDLGNGVKKVILDGVDVTPPQDTPDTTPVDRVTKIIEEWRLGYKMGSALKYILRSCHTAAVGSKDLTQAMNYLEWAIQLPDNRDHVAPRCRGHHASATHPETVASAWGIYDTTLVTAIIHIYLNEPNVALGYVRMYVAKRSRSSIKEG